jgi:UDP-N-acetylglucosamine 4,6-dehydratase (inverting)
MTGSSFSLDGKDLLITGGSGSFGRRFARTVLERYKPRRVVIYSRGEMKQFEMQNMEPFRSNSKIMRWFIGDVRDAERLRKAMEDIDVVVHAAALKQVPAAEYNPFEAVKTNIIGAENVINASLDACVKQVIALSTDKAAAPINLYGATKLASDKLFVAANNHKGSRDIRFSVVRYGNVMGSRGSVIPFFKSRRQDGVLPITDERMTRFSITLQEGVDFVLDSFGRMWGGEIFVPRIPSYRILDVAKAIAPEAKLEFIGIRPGEKLHEEMVSEDDAIATIDFGDYFVILPSTYQWDEEKFRLESGPKQGTRCEYGFRYSSGTNDRFLAVDELESLIAQEVDI